jgi:hypothetical protein
VTEETVSIEEPMISALYHILALLYVPLLWALIVFHAIAGLTGLFAPDRLRSLFAVFLSKGRIRTLGGVLLVLGAMLYIGAEKSDAPVVGKVLAVLFFIDGGVRLIMPTVSVVYTEWLMSRSDGVLRLLALVAIALAAFFYMAAQIPPETADEIVDPERLNALLGLLNA